MSKSTDLKNFLKALEDVKNDYVCKICLELCKNPVTLSKCFHIICGDHFEGLMRCPECNVSLAGCTTVADDRLESTIEATKKLSNIFDKHRSRESRADRSSSAGKVQSETPKPSSNAAKRSSRRESLIPETPKPSLNAAKRSARNDSLIQTRVLDAKEKENDKTVENVAKTKANTISSKTKADTNLVKTKEDTKQKDNLSNLSNTTSKFNKAVEKRNVKGETALHIACRLGKIERVQELLKEGALTNTKDHAGWTPLHEAVQNAHLDLVKLLLQHNALVNVPGCSNETPLHEAVRYAQNRHEKNNKIRIAIIEELVKNGADVNVRNCKGETPLQLATPALKEVLITSSENLIQTQSLNITLISERHSEIDADDIKVYSISKFKTVQGKLKALSKHHPNVHIESKFSQKVTHLIVDTDDDLVVQSSSDVLLGIVNSIWIVSSYWISKSTEEKLERFEDYEVKGVNSTAYNGPKLARYNKYKQFPGLFDGCHFYLHNFSAVYKISETLEVSKQILTKLITDADGVVLRRVPNPESIPESEKMVPYHADRNGKLANCSHFIIFKDKYEPMYNMSHLKALPIGWLIECIEKYELCEPDIYLL